jgi:hypothetical protein
MRKYLFFMLFVFSLFPSVFAEEQGFIRCDSGSTKPIAAWTAPGQPYILEQLECGRTITIAGRENNYTKVKVGINFAYVESKYVQQKQDQTQIKQIQSPKAERQQTLQAASEQSKSEPVLSSNPKDAVKSETREFKPNSVSTAVEQSDQGAESSTHKSDVSKVSSKPKKIKIHGYVTSVISLTSFEIEDYRITRDLSLNLELEKSETEQVADFKPEDIRVGTELEINGQYDENIAELKAQSIKVILEEHRKVKRTALLEHAPQIARDGDNWRGTFFADGQRIAVNPETQAVIKLNKSERDLDKKMRKDKKKEPNNSKGAETDDAAITKLESLEQITPNTFMTYEGVRNDDGSISALRLEFMKNELEKGEASLWKQLSPKVKMSNFIKGKSGEVQIRGVGKFKLVPNAEAQEYIANLGLSLIPVVQRKMSATEMEKIPFQFFLVQDKEPNAFATANGIVVVNDSMLETLENESQLAFVLAHEISHAVQEHYWRQLQYHHKKLAALQIGGAIAGAFGGWGSVAKNIANLTVAAVRNGYSRDLENQADRMGLEYMSSAGFDPREAPRAWKVMTSKYGDQATNLFWSRHDNNATRRSYLMVELRNNYNNLDYSKMSIDQNQYNRIAQIIKSGRASKYKVKVKY